MVNWDALEKMGVSKTSLEQQGLLDSMLKGYKTNKLVPLTLTLTGARVKLDARLSFITMPDGQIGLGIHGIRKEPELERPYFGHIFTEEDKKNLRETGNMGRVAELNLNGGSYTPCLISIDKNTNELVAVRQENVYIPSEVKGIRLTADEINALKEGQPVYVDGMTSKNGKPFDATLQYSAERRGLEFIYPESKGFNQQSLGGVQLSPNQIKMLSEGHTILVEDMKRTDGALFSSFVTLDKVTGRPQYSRTPDGFSERQVPVVPAEVYGHVFTAQERANLQDGKTILVSDLKSANNKTFSSYLKVNANSGQLQYFQENPDIRRNTARRAAQADDTQNRQQEQIEARIQEVQKESSQGCLFPETDTQPLPQQPPANGTANGNRPDGQMRMFTSQPPQQPVQQAIPQTVQQPVPRPQIVQPQPVPQYYPGTPQPVPLQPQATVIQTTRENTGREYQSPPQPATEALTFDKDDENDRELLREDPYAEYIDFPQECRMKDETQAELICC